MTTGRKRLWFKRHDSSGHFPDGRLKLDVSFQDSDGNEYVWTPDWANTRSFFVEASRVEQLNVPSGRQAQSFVEAAATIQSEAVGSIRPNVKIWCLELSDLIRSGASGNQIARIAHAVFDFVPTDHEHPGITSAKWQSVYDWIMSLVEVERPVGEKVSMLVEFVANLTPEGSEARKLAPQLAWVA